ncbi:hypothetical protein PBI_OVECHKIN_45 [Mycobacterium phage Ovechkin]|uniref:DUF7304 domain-containing protein n=1 Tax=Mycobacterium phage Ovechkin TaxID=1673889 RepID=A0A0H4TI77_9CAUD|nr:hypothetical protein PBI_OVECHKIN_45 [Mycobacterium phage Ovechkin]AKQ06947.1 hypothetical protein PBI_OVECHKIN_45 [Mycobacterium phage Ovechkin]
MSELNRINRGVCPTPGKKQYRSQSEANRFIFYSDPQRLIKKSHGGVTVGLGNDDGTDLAYLNVGDGYRNDGDVLLTADELTDLIDQLTIIRNAMRLT